jgi:hypothetical protein
MRKFVLIVAAALTAAVLSVAQAQTRPQLGSSLSVSSFKVIYGAPVTLSGQVSDRRSGVRIVVLARPFTRAGIAPLATVVSGNRGRWRYQARPTIATTYAASVAGHGSRTLMVGVRPALSLRTLADGSLQARVVAARSFRERLVQLQQHLVSGWTTVAKRPLGRGSTIVFPSVLLPGHSLQLRLALSVNAAGPGYLGGFSRTLPYPAPTLTLSPSTFKVVSGQTLRLSGRVSSRRAGLALTLLARPFSQPEFQQIATIHTRAAGRWQTHIRPSVMTSYQTRWANASSPVRTIGVRPAILLRNLSDDRLHVQIRLAKPLTGRSIQVQKHTAGGWKTVAKLRLSRASSATITPATLPAGTSTLRIAISVNQAGAGYLGATSPAFIYHH